MTIIELIIGMVIIGVAFYLLISIFIAIAPRTARVETIDKKIYLAQGKMEEFLARPFSLISNEGPSAFTGNFSNYSFRINVAYVAATDLNTPIAGPTNFKNVKVQVWGGATERTASVEVTTLVTSYEIK